MSIISQYRASLKDRRAEELLDLRLYRPIAFLMAKALLPTPVTPNQITLAAILSAALAGASLARGDREGLVLGALLYMLSNILDCCDGMVARMKGTGTQLGRMIDVFADSLSGVLVYAGLGIGLVRGAHSLPIAAWWLVLLGGASFALQAALFDRQRNRFLSQSGGASSIARELAVVSGSMHAGGRGPKRMLSSIYLRYMGWQHRGAGEACIDARTLRLWSLAGSTTHVTVVALALLFDAPMALFGYTIVAANLWMLGLHLYGRRRRRTRSARHANKSATPRKVLPAALTSDVAAPTVAVILAAGAGTRLRPLTDEVPKPLVDVGGRPLLARSIDALRAAGVERLVVVAGYRAASVERFLEREYPGLDVEILYNHNYDISNNAASVLLAARSLEGCRLLLLDGDLLYDPAIVEQLVVTGGRTSRLIVRRTDDLEEEEIKVVLDGRGLITAIGKRLDPRRCAGESIGIALFDRDMTARLFRTLDERMRRRGGTDEFYEASFQQMIDEGCTLDILDAADRYCIEIDTPDDLAAAEIMLRYSERPVYS
jgi:choline kinase/phosphatidylglycerophosphate synthase